MMSSRTALDLLDLDFVHSQRRLLPPRDFAKECRRRGLVLADLSLGESYLDAFHRVGALVPLYRIRNDLRSVFAAARRDDRDALRLAIFQQSESGTERWLRHYRESGRLHDPRAERYRPWREYWRSFGDTDARASRFLYSPYQLLLIPDLRPLPPVARLRTGSDEDRYRFKVGSGRREHWQAAAKVNRDLVIALSALEARYLPLVVNHVTHHGDGEPEAVQRYRETFDPAGMLAWLGWDSERVRGEASRLLRAAESIDPLGEWHRLVRAGRPATWDKLRFDALIASDHRVAAEVLLSFYEDLVSAGLAPPLDPPSWLSPFPSRQRLGGESDDLDELLMELGLSPHPSLVLVLEGESEMLLAPRAGDMLEIPRRQDFIKLVNAHGADQPLTLLASYAISPGLGQQLDAGTKLTRPPTRFLVVVDAEGKYKTSADRAALRERWVRHIARAARENHGVDLAEDDLRQLIEVQTWNRRGQSLELAHFTDLEIARGILATYQGSNLPAPSKLPAIIAGVRRSSGTLSTMWRHWKPEPSKTRLAGYLWPTLERKIARAVKRGTVDHIPLARVLLHAATTASQVRRHSVMIRRAPVSRPD